MRPAARGGLAWCANLARTRLPVRKERAIVAYTDGRHKWAPYLIEQRFVAFLLENAFEVKGLRLRSRAPRGAALLRRTSSTTEPGVAISVWMNDDPITGGIDLNPLTPLATTLA